MPYIVGPTTPSHLNMSAGIVQSGIKTTEATGANNLVSLTAADYQSVDYQVQVIRGSNYNSALIKVIHDGTNTYMTEFGSIAQPVGIATFGSDINGGNVRILASPTTSDSTVFKIVRTLTKV